jgi:hypothetical protein
MPCVRHPTDSTASACIDPVSISLRLGWGISLGGKWGVFVSQQVWILPWYCTRAQTLNSNLHTLLLFTLYQAMSRTVF